MPELPDITVYVEAIAERAEGAALERVRVANPFLLRTTEPPLAAVEGRALTSVGRLGKRIALGFDNDIHLVLHLMIAGRFRWRDQGAKVPGRIGLAALDFATGTLIVTEASKKRRASLHVVRGDDLADFHPRGIEPLECGAADFQAAIRRENRTLKRALTDQRILSGIGNAYSDEILHRARLSPMRLTSRLGDDEVERLHGATIEVLEKWIERLRAEAADRFPEKVTAFRDEMAVHGRYRQPCPDCGSPVQRIRYADNECNYCAKCQNQGRLLADRSLSKLLKKDWPKTLDELEARRGSNGRS
jgi:formamidopyrimidine-DNA glycosylase